MKGTPITIIGLILVSMILNIKVNSINKDKFIALELKIAKNKTSLDAKIPAKIKFYTIPGYNCDTSNIPGYCSNMYPVTQAEYDKKNSHLFKITSN